VSKKSTAGRYKINVTQENIDDAIKNNSYHCAVATAIKEQVPDAALVQVDIQTIRLSLPSDRKRLVYITPPAVQQYIVDFDAGDKVEPITFTLYRPAWEQPMSVHHNGKTIEDEPMEAIVMSEGTKVVARVKTPKRIPSIGARSIRTYGMRRMRVNHQESAVEE
jgi:hypothetical protein